jgi:hypothetical protein
MNVCFWHIADITIMLNHVRFWEVERTLGICAPMPAYDPKRTSATPFQVLFSPGTMRVPT